MIKCDVLGNYRVGLIFKGQEQVGTFQGFTSEDCNGCRKFNEVALNDITDVYKVLRFLYVQRKGELSGEGLLLPTEGPSELIEDFGFGTDIRSASHPLTVLRADNSAWLGWVHIAKCPRPTKE